MRTWTRAGTAGDRCGSCRKAIRAEAPLLIIQIPALGPGRSFRRCASCAAVQGYVVPADLPPRPKPVALVAQALTRFTAGMLPIDYKNAAAGEREPGDEE